jgi:hypothetical protein
MRWPSTRISATSSILQAYNEVLPFGDTLQVAIGTTKYLVLDHFCVRSGCACTYACLTLLPIGDEEKPARGTGRIEVDYAIAAWMLTPARRYLAMAQSSGAASKAPIPVSTRRCGRGTTSCAPYTPTAASAISRLCKPCARQVAAAARRMPLRLRQEIQKVLHGRVGAPGDGSRRQPSRRHRGVSRRREERLRRPATRICVAARRAPLPSVLLGSHSESIGVPRRRSSLRTAKSRTRASATDVQDPQ